jgi:hypothetical protein
MYLCLTYKAITNQLYTITAFGQSHRCVRSTRKGHADEATEQFMDLTEFHLRARPSSEIVNPCNARCRRGSSIAHHVVSFAVGFTLIIARAAMFNSLGY